MKSNQKKLLFLTLFEENLANISQTCKIVGIDRKTFYNWIKKDKMFEGYITPIISHYKK